MSATPQALVWNAPTNGPVAGYHVYSKHALTDAWTIVGTTTETRWPITVDSPQAFFTVSSFNSSGESFAIAEQQTIQPNFPLEVQQAKALRLLPPKMK